jgi:hypothetical protein
MMMRSLIKASVVDFHKGKEEILSMDDELPVNKKIKKLKKKKRYYK